MNKPAGADAVEGDRLPVVPARPGYRGRTGIHELLVTNDTLKDMVVQRVNAGVIRNEALKDGHAHPAAGRLAQGAARA